jgi:dihydroorotate dehydrogenase
LIYSRLLRPLLFRFDPETVHEWSVRWAEQLLPRIPRLAAILRVDDPVELAGLSFPNRIGLAAGFDKNARFVRAAEALGFGHIEVGAVTPLAQGGHPRPRLFRVAGGSLRNRMGFNNDGVVAVLERLPSPSRIRVGLNLGKGTATPLEAAVEDYLACMRLSYSRVDYFSVNVSSPNTVDLRELGKGSRLRELCLALVHTSTELAAGGSRRSVWIKVSPDQSDHELRALADTARETGIDGLVATNTTTLREGPYRLEDPTGGLSGGALQERSLQVIELLRRHLGSGFPLIGLGGVHDATSALRMRAAGADLVQIYTGFVYGGPLLPARLAGAIKIGRVSP